jgi:hypothetical protein
MDAKFTPKQQRALKRAKTAAERESLKKLYLSQKAAASAGGQPASKPKAKAPGPGKGTARRHLPFFLDPMCPHPVPSLASDGKALDYTGLASSDFQVDTVNQTLLIVTNIGNSGSVAYTVKVNADGQAITGSPQVHTIPTLALSAKAGGPSATRAMKLSVSVVNCSNNYKVGGRVTYINSSQRLPPRMSSALTEYASILSGIKTSPYRKRINGKELMEPKQLIAYPVDNTEYSMFREFAGTLDVDGFLTHVCTGGDGQTTLDADVNPRSMSICAWVFEPASDVQDYSFTVRASYYSRWPLSSVPGQSMRPVPTAPAGIINHVRDVAESHASELLEVAAGGLTVSLAPRIADAARAAGSFLGRAFGRAAGLGEAGLGAAEGAIGGMELGGMAGAAVPLLAL